MMTSSPNPHDSTLLLLPARPIALSRLAASSSLFTSLVRLDLLPAPDLGLLVTLLFSFCCCLLLLSVTRRRSKGIRSRMDRDEVESTEDTSSAFSFASALSSPSSLISSRASLLRSLIRSGMLMESFVPSEIYGPARVGDVGCGRGGRAGTRSERGVGVDGGSGFLPLLAPVPLPATVTASAAVSWSSSSLPISTSSASRYHFRRRVQRPQPS